MLKQVLALLIISLSAFHANSQQCVISNVKENTLYVAIENKLNIAVENTNCNALFLTTDNGVINGEYCNYTITPERTGKAIIWINKVEGIDTIAMQKFVFYVKDLPAPTVKLSGKTKGFIKKKELLMQYKLFADLSVVDSEVNVNINSFICIVIRNKQVIFTKENIGPAFNQKILEEFTMLEKSDVILIVNVNASYGDNASVNLSPIELIVE